MNTKNRVFWLLTALHVVFGPLFGFTKPTSATQDFLDAVLSGMVIIGIYVWCRSDILLRSPPHSSRWALWSALVPLPVLPVYLLRTRSPRQAARSLAKAVAAYAALVLVLLLSASVAAFASAASQETPDN